MSSRTALLVIDAQLGLFDEAYPVEKEVLGTIRALLERARAAGAPVIYVQHDGGPGHPMEPGSQYWPLHPAVTPLPGEPVIHKRASDSFYQTVLQEELEVRGITRLVVTGAQSELCVDATCRRAISQGFDVTLVADGHSTGEREALDVRQIIAYENEVLSDVAHPDHQITVTPAADIIFA